jgi:hypothetical protein
MVCCVYSSLDMYFSQLFKMVNLLISGHRIKNAIHIITNRTFNSVCWFINGTSQCSVCFQVKLWLAIPSIRLEFPYRFFSLAAETMSYCLYMASGYFFLTISSL